LKVLSTIIVPPHLSASGAARAGFQLTDALSEYCDISIASMYGSYGGQAGPAPRLTVKAWLPVSQRGLPRRYRSLFYKSDIPHIIRRGAYDLVHIHNPIPALEMARVARACIRSRIPYVVSTHGFNELANSDSIYQLGALRRTAWHFLVRRPVSEVISRASEVFALSPADLDVVRSFGFPGTPRIVPNGVELPAEASAESDMAACRKFRIPGRGEFSGITCMFLGNHTPNKGVPILLEAFSRIKCPYLLILGGDCRSEIDYDSYKRGARDDQRIVITGRLTNDEVSALLRRSDLFVFPSLADTFPLVVLEAMAHGVPVLASDVGGIRYQLDPGCGRLVPPGNVATLRAAVEEMARERDCLREMGRLARVRAAHTFTWKAAAEAALEGYRRACILKTTPNGE
jgi:glycosyltransferase involved in cell wall biosynthesis